jgi:hypothetical protein
MKEWDAAREWLKLAAWHNAIKSEMHVRATEWQPSAESALAVAFFLGKLRIRWERERQGRREMGL